MKVASRNFLPTTTASVHAASMAFHKGHPVFTWFGGSREGAPDVAIYINNLNDDGKTIIIGDKDIVPRWNPILVSINDRLILFEKSGYFCDRWQTFVYDITDWSNNITNKEIVSSAFILPAGLNGPVKSCPIFNKDEMELICGSSVETIYDWTSYIETYSINHKEINKLEYVVRSNPLIIKNKVTYQDSYSGRSAKSMGVIQPTLWEVKDEYGFSKLHAFFRSSKGLDKIYYSKNTSVGFGPIWEDPLPTNLDNPNSAIDVVYLKDKLYLVHNPDKTHRKPIVLSEIKVNIQENSVKCDILNQIVITDKINENTPFNSPELSYPYMIEHDGKLHLVYTYARSKIEYVVLEA